MAHSSEEGGLHRRGRLSSPHALSALVTIGITLLMLIPIPDTDLTLDVGFDHSDKVVHFVLFFLWAAAVRRSLREAGVRAPDLWVLGLALVLGALLEVLQGLGSYRQPDVFDGVADAAGALIYVVLVRFLGRLR